MYERIAGIKPLKAGYKEIQIAPIPGGPLTSAEASYDSPYGKVSTAWKIENNTFVLDATVPPNASAKILIPANTQEDLILDGKIFSENANVKLIKKAVNVFELFALPGNYKFKSKLK